MTCEFCGSNHDGTFATGRFCNMTCARAFSTKDRIRKRKNRLCESCGSTTANAKFCSSRCQHEWTYRNFIQKWLSGRDDGTRETGYSCSIKRFLREKYNDSCSRCGWNEKHPKTGKVPLEVDHIDGKWTNNSPDNVRLLCPNCHSLTDSYRGMNVGNAEPRKHRPGKLTVNSSSCK